MRYAWIGKGLQTTTGGDFSGCTLTLSNFALQTREIIMNIDEIAKALDIDDIAELQEIADYEEWEGDNRGEGI